MAKKQFKAESKRLLDMMINSIYTHKEIFLRELISNASDAIDKLYYKQLMDNKTGLSREDFGINIEQNKTERTLRISDNGMGMTKAELEDNLGTIAKSGSLAFKTQESESEEAKKALEDIDIIGQFGVGFYSAFMVSDKVSVISRAYDEEKAYIWESNGADGYTVKEADKADVGTEVILHIKPSTEEEDYDKYLEAHTIEGLVKKYSDYVRYPIKMMVKSYVEADNEDDANDEESLTNTEKEPKKVLEEKVLNSMVPLWKKSKSDITKEEYSDFYREKFFDFTDPVKVIHTSVEGVTSYTALLFIPKNQPYDYYMKDFKKGLKLYSSGVMIMDSCGELLPDCFGFVKGLVDSQDLSLNISREMLQHDRQLKAIAVRLEKKIQSELLSLLKNDREAYEEFYKSFGLTLKFGIYNDYGQKKELLQDLLLFYSSKEKKLVTFKEYVERMQEEQKNIYFAAGESIEKIDKMPQTELLKEKGFEILYLTENVDEFALRMMMFYDDKNFKSVADGDLDINASEEEKEETRKKEEELKELLEFMKVALEGKVKEVKLSERLKSHPVCLSTAGGLSIEMEKVINAMPVGDEKVSAEKTLEINKDHEVIDAIKATFDKGDVDKVKLYANLLYNQALLIEGVSVEDPISFSNDICSLIK